MPTYPWIEFPLLVLMVVGPLMIIGSRSGMAPDRTDLQKVKVKGLGQRVIQLVALLVLLPLAAILALEGKIEGTPGALIGVAIGYTLSGVSEAVKVNRVNSDRQKSK